MMRLYHNKPRRPKPKAAANNGTQKQRVQAANASGALIGLLILLAWVRLSIAAAGASNPALVGDRVQLGAAAVTFPDQIVAARAVTGPFSPAGKSCSLDVNEMSNPGGVISVLAVRADGVMVSWAGGPTSAKSDCHRLNMPVLISADDYESLVKTRLPKH